MYGISKISVSQKKGPDPHFIGNLETELFPPLQNFWIWSTQMNVVPSDAKVGS